MFLNKIQNTEKTHKKKVTQFCYCFAIVLLLFVCNKTQKMQKNIENINLRKYFYAVVFQI